MFLANNQKSQIINYFETLTYIISYKINKYPDEVKLVQIVRTPLPIYVIHFALKFINKYTITTSSSKYKKHIGLSPSLSMQITEVSYNPCQRSIQLHFFSRKYKVCVCIHHCCWFCGLCC